MRRSTVRAILSWAMILTAMLQTSVLAQSQGATKPSPPTIVFICQHGAAKSVIAAAYFNKLAAERHLNYHAIARGVTPQPDISAPTMSGLQKDGMSYPNQKPQALTAEDLDRAARIIAFCPVPTSLAKGHPVDSFDVPSPMDSYDQSRDAILVQVRNLIDQLAREPKKN